MPTLLMEQKQREEAHPLRLFGGTCSCWPPWTGPPGDTHHTESPHMWASWAGLNRSSVHVSPLPPTPSPPHASRRQAGSLLDRLVGGNTFNSSSERQIPPRNLSESSEGGGDWWEAVSHGATWQNIEDYVLQMEGPTKWNKSEWNLVRTLGHTGYTQKAQGRAAALPTALMAGKGLGQTAACIGSDYGKVNKQFLINNTHISVSKLSTCACLCNIK